MREMNSPFIIKLFDAYEDSDYLYLILEYCQLGDLFTYQSNSSK